MRAAARILRNPWWLVWACLFAGVRPAAADSQVVIADFDGDSLRDRAELEHSTSVLRVWLSTTDHTSIIRTPTPILAITATDLDGDRREELIGRGTAAALHIWTKRTCGFVPVQPKRRTPAAGPGRAPKALDDAPGDRWLAEARSGPPPLSLAPRLAPRAAAPSAVCPRAASAVIPSAGSAFPHLGPRPPPPSGLL